MIQVDLILHESDASEVEKTIAALYQLYPDIPPDIHKAAEGLAWFYTRGETPSAGKDTPAKKAPKKAFSFEQDASLIYAAFYSTYNISLTTVDFLHWWEFMALFEGLPETTLIQRVMGCKAVCRGAGRACAKGVTIVNKVILKKDGGLHINGVEVLSVTGFSVKMCDMDTSTVVVQFDTSFLEVEVGVSDFKAGATLQSEIAPRNAVIQKMMEIGLTYTEAMDALESSKTHLAKNLGTYATGNDPLSVALYPDWRG